MPEWLQGVFGALSGQGQGSGASYQPSVPSADNGGTNWTPIAIGGGVALVLIVILVIVTR